ncbi:alpha/beta fold hydrolase [Stappia sp. ES.058]|uniref:alpha/beta fold hydrolase n=1 Tax=Stappia sp. ES.058 TaxID=1881061 RepID=UPI0008796E2C|nr:alpha/beta fold hydrolase [Stappia sp. ES.058]SDU37949.1 pyruvate dehydrogenase E2 component (dihydrolipoamide acetyltransferase) [Stappia sp. ES.058]
MEQRTPAGCLPFTESGPHGAGAPVVLLHGFGGDAAGWSLVQAPLAAHRRTLAFDLPGHGQALDWPEIGGAGIAARAVRQSLAALGLEKVHLVGHSMGGATAVLVALKAPERIASLTLLAPGGFGFEINHRLLRRYAAATDAGELEMLLEQFFGYEFDLPPFVARQAAEARARPGARDALIAIVEQLIDGKTQKVLPRDALAGLEVPVKIVWGTQDRVLPTRQSHKLPGEVATHVFERVGHMPHLEIPEAVCRLIREQLAHA